MPTYMYVSLQGEDRIVIFTIDPETGNLAPQGEVKVEGGPAPLAIGPLRQSLYVGRRGSQQISSFGINQKTGGLTLSGTVELETDPCFLATDRRGRFVLASSYEGAGVSVHPVGDDGSVGMPPVEWRHTARGAHSFQTDPANRFAFVPHTAGRGPNLILQFRFDEATGHLTPSTTHVGADHQAGRRIATHRPYANPTKAVRRLAFVWMKHSPPERPRTGDAIHTHGGQTSALARTVADSFG